MGYNAIASKYVGISYDDLVGCELALVELEEEQHRLNEKLQELEELRQNYEENVYPHLRRAISRMDSLSVTYNNALNILLDAEKSTEDECVRLQGKVKVICGEINKRVSEINDMEGLVEANLARIRNMIARYKIELNEVLQQIVSLREQYRELLKNN